MPRSGCLALHGVNSNLKKKKKKVFSAVPKNFLSILLVTYLVTPKVLSWWALRGEKILKLYPSRMLENAFPKNFPLFSAMEGDKEKQNVQ